MEHYPYKAMKLYGDMVSIRSIEVEDAVNKNMSILVTCYERPNETSLYTVEELKNPIETKGPFSNSRPEGPPQYFLWNYKWKGSVVSEQKETAQESVETPIVKELGGVTEAAQEQPVAASTAPILTYYINKVVTTTTTIEANLAQYVGAKITQRREELKMSQVDVHKKGLSLGLDFSASTISTVEKGENYPNLKTLESLCIALDLHISELFPPKTT